MEDPGNAIVQRLWGDYHRSVFAFFQRRLRDRERSRECTQDVFFSVSKNIDNLLDESKEAAWIFKIAANHWKNELRARQAKKRSADVVPLDPAATDGVSDVEDGNEIAIDRLLASEQRRRFHEAVDHLPARQRDCVLYRCKGLKYKEIAAILEISVQTVKSQLHDATQRLRLILRELPDQPD